MNKIFSCIKTIVRPFIPASIRRKIRRWEKQRVVNRAMQARSQGKDLHLDWGVSMIGDLHRSSGLGAASRANLQCLKYAGIPTQEVPMTDEQLMNFKSCNKVMLIHTNPDQLDRICELLPAQQWQGKYVIGEWVWEQEQLPDWWMPYLDLFDEIWTPSRFAAAAIQKATDKTVRVLPHMVEPICDERWDCKAFGLPDDVFLCLVTFDYHSVIARKNPEGAIKAFCKAFANCKDQVGLVLKARNTPPEIVRQLRGELKDWPHVFCLIEDYTKEQVNSLIRSVDVYISLHRSEGFGLVLAEAMYLGTPVVATNWSGNTEFMNSDVACMVNAPLITLQKDELPFLKGSRWAEPDINEAAYYLRKLYDDSRWRVEISQRAKAYVQKYLSVSAVSAQMEDYLLEIREKCEI